MNGPGEHHDGEHQGGEDRGGEVLEAEVLSEEESAEVARRFAGVVEPRPASDLDAMPPEGGDQ